MRYRVELRHTSPNANPERTTAELEAEDEDALRKEIKRIAKQEMSKPPRARSFRPGWTSYADADYWGKAEGIEIIALSEITE